MSKRESKTQLDILRYLRQQGLLFWRFSPDTYIPAIGRYIKHEYVPSGLPDIMVLHERGFIGLEVKRPKGGKASSDQLLKQKQFEAHGAEYHFVKSVDEVKALDL